MFSHFKVHLRYTYTYIYICVRIRTVCMLYIERIYLFVFICTSIFVYAYAKTSTYKYCSKTYSSIVYIYMYSDKGFHVYIFNIYIYCSNTQICTNWCIYVLRTIFCTFMLFILSFAYIYSCLLGHLSIRVRVYIYIHTNTYIEIKRGRCFNAQVPQITLNSK